MKYSILFAGILTAIAAPAFADNPDVDSALKNRPELSDFVQALERTGVLQSLEADHSYTIFAPTNEALAKITKEKYPCFTLPECQAAVTPILKNHIVPGLIHINEAEMQQGGFYPLSKRFVPIGEMGRNRYTVEGNYILDSFEAGDGNAPTSAKVYEINGLIANPYERMTLEYDANQPQEQVTTNSTTIPDPACRGGACSDSTTRTITYSRSIITP